MRFLVIVLIGLGIFFRFDNLDHKVYWYDETFTSLRSSGYTEAEIVQHFNQTSIVSVADLQQYQHPAPDRGIGDTVHSLAVEDNQHPPLYYVLANLWMRGVGSSVTAARLLPALISLLTLPCVYWLCQELFVKTGIFTSSLPAWLAVGLMAVSPLQVLYAQESRQYSLWSVTTLLTTAALLRAMRLRTRLSWGIYAIALTISLYTYLLSVLVAAAHFIYVLVISNRSSKLMFPYLSATLFSSIAFLPWAWVVLTNLSQAHKGTSWMGINRSLSFLMPIWASLPSRLFYDRGNGLGDRLVQVALLLLVGYAFYSLCRRTPRLVWLLIVTLTAVPALALMLPDVVSGGLRSTFPRYLLPALLGMQLAVIYLLAAKLAFSSTQQPASVHKNRLKVSHTQWLWRGITVTILSAGIFSCAVSASAETWWIKTLSKENPAVARVINQAAKPLVISDADTADLLSLSHLLNSNVALLIRPRCYTCHINSAEKVDLAIFQIPEEFSEIFLFHPRASRAWQRSLAQIQTYQLESVANEEGKALWRIVNK
jgi:uncharacterized membrane protein